MKLTRVERWILSHQYRILQALYEDEAEYYETALRIIENGYEFHYDEISGHICEEEHVMSEERCLEIINILDMFAMLKRAYASLDDKTGIDEYSITYHGFDGNNEAYERAYADFFLFGQSTKRFEELEIKEGINSHAYCLEPYRRMLGEWIKSTNKHELSKEDLLRISAARQYPKE